VWGKANLHSTRERAGRPPFPSQTQGEGGKIIAVQGETQGLDTRQSKTKERRGKKREKKGSMKNSFYVLPEKARKPME